MLEMPYNCNIYVYRKYFKLTVLILFDSSSYTFEDINISIKDNSNLFEYLTQTLVFLAGIQWKKINFCLRRLDLLINFMRAQSFRSGMTVLKKVGFKINELIKFFSS